MQTLRSEITFGHFHDGALDASDRAHEDNYTTMARVK